MSGLPVAAATLWASDVLPVPAGPSTRTGLSSTTPRWTTVAGAAAGREPAPRRSVRTCSTGLGSPDMSFNIWTAARAGKPHPPRGADPGRSRASARPGACQGGPWRAGRGGEAQPFGLILILTFGLRGRRGGLPERGKAAGHVLLRRGPVADRDAQHRLAVPAGAGHPGGAVGH